MISIRLLRITFTQIHLQYGPLFACCYRHRVLAYTLVILLALHMHRIRETCNSALSYLRHACFSFTHHLTNVTQKIMIQEKFYFCIHFPYLIRTTRLTQWYPRAFVLFRRSSDFIRLFCFVGGPKQTFICQLSSFYMLTLDNNVVILS